MQNCLPFPKKFSLGLCALTALVQLHSSAAGGSDQLLIRYREDATASEIRRGMNNARLHLLEYFQTGPMAESGKVGLVTAETELDSETAVAVLRQDPAIEIVEKNGKIHAAATSNDPFFTAGDLWNMYGDTSTPANAFGTQAAEAWAAGHTGSQSVYVAILDGGVEITHPDLSANIWTNPFDTTDASDNDSNGFADDLHGWNFINDNNNVTEPGDAQAHGSLIAGIIGAVGGNGVGVVGVNWNVTMIPVRILENGDGDESDAILGIDYCIDLKQRHNLNIVALNASWGSTTYNQLLNEAIIRAAKAGILFVAAAGNTPANNDTTPFWPANIDTTVATSGETAASYNSVISVASIDENGALSSFSNFGATKVHIGAPGEDVVSTYLVTPGGSYGLSSGTSLAAPHVTGAIALYASTHPGATPAQIRAALLNSAAPTASLAGKTTTGGRLDLSTVINQGTIAGRRLFYNNSAWDGNNAAANASDDAAIATDKSALLPGGTGAFANYSSYTRGINGIMVDIANIGDASSISANDFTFKVGNNNTPAGWATATAPTSVAVRAGAGTGGSTRITIIWADNAIQKQWLQITVLANGNTGLSSADVFYFGNAIGESGNSTSNAQVNSSDENAARIHPHNFLNPATIDDPYDYNRDKRVNSSDENFSRVGSTSFLTALKLIQVP